MLIEPQQEKSEERRFFEAVESNQIKRITNEIIETIKELELYYSITKLMFSETYEKLSNTQKQLVLNDIAKVLQDKKVK